MMIPAWDGLQIGSVGLWRRARSVEPVGANRLEPQPQSETEQELASRKQSIWILQPGWEHGFAIVVREPVCSFCASRQTVSELAALPRFIEQILPTLHYHQDEVLHVFEVQTPSQNGWA